MKLFEYQAKRLLADFQIPVTAGETASNPDEVYSIVKKMDKAAVIKAQVLTGGRGKAGGVKIVSSPDEAKTVSENIFGMTIKGNPVHLVLVTPAIAITNEYYISIVINSSEKTIECIISEEGGMEIEEVASHNSEKIHTIHLSPEIFAESKPITIVLRKIFSEDVSDKILGIMEKMFYLFIKNDCSLLEINPLVSDNDGNLIALDAKIVIDDNGLYKHPELDKYKNPEEYSPDEREARKSSLSFVSLDGDIGCMVNGAGLAMATMDLIKYAGGAPANFLDIGGSSNPQKVVDGLRILLRNKKIKAILLNIFGGITRCDDIAIGLIRAEEESTIPVPLVVRLIGTNDIEGIGMLQENGFNAFSDLMDAVKSVVDKSRSAIK